MYGNGYKPKILIVDDDGGNVHFIWHALRSEYLCVLAYNGEEALEQINKRENSDIAVILADEIMPGMSGSEVLEQSAGIVPHAIRIIMTGKPEIYQNKLEVDRFLRKPFKPEVLVKFINEGIRFFSLKREFDNLSEMVVPIIENNNKIRKLFSKYLPYDQIVKLECKDQECLREVEKKEMSVFYSDICGFTSLAEELSPEDTVELLNRYFQRMTEIVVRHHGIIDKYIGDEIMANFGMKEYPVFDDCQNARNAVRCAIEMKHAIEELNSENEADNLPALRFGVGINTGEVVVGNIGSDQFLDYTVIGDEVNVAARIQKLTRDEDEPNRILIGEKTFEYVRDIVGDRFKDLGLQKVKGKGKKLRVFEIFGLKK